MFEKLSKHADLVSKMTEKAGVDIGDELNAGTVSGSFLRNMVMVCTHCKHVGECQHHLATAPQGDVPEYCLNKEVFAHLNS